MNISTYESRIKALEDQLNPPAPSGPALLSVVVTPDITLADDRSLNAVIAEKIPIAIGNLEEVVVDASTSAVPSGSTYSVTATPGEHLIAFLADNNSQDPMVVGERGESATIRVNRGNNSASAISFMASATAKYPPEGMGDAGGINVTVRLTGL